ncbi:MAG: 6-bladed beta-propeller [bacterium]|nr:6-bladed beta-propeller [bacterium]
MHTLEIRHTGTIAVLTLLLFGCQTSAPLEDGKTADLVWPHPPAQARILHRLEIRTPEDLGVRPGFARRLFNWISGRETPRLIRPHSVATDRSGRLWVTDPGARLVHVFDAAKSNHRALPRRGDPPLISPIAVTHDSEGTAYVTDSAAGVIRRFDPDGHALPDWGADAGLTRPSGVAFDPRIEMLWVVDTGGHRVVGFDASGAVVRTIGERGSAAGRFNYPTHLAVAPDGRLFVTDSLNFRVQILSAAGEALGSIGELGDGPGSFSKPKGVALDRDGHVYVVDALFDNLQIFDQTGQLLLHFGESGSGPGAFWLPAGIHIAQGRTIYVADAYNQRVQVFEYVGE